MANDRPILNRSIELILLVGIILGGWLLRARDLDRFKLTDETKWAFRSANFTLALHRGDYLETFQRSHPGVTTMWAGMIGIELSLPGYADRATRYVENTSYRTDLRENGVEVMQILIPARIAVISFNMLILAICYFYLSRLIGTPAALFGTLLLTYEPFFLGHTRILHVDGFLSSFMYLSLTTFLVYLKSRRLADLILSGLAAGLTWLTKTPGFYLVGGVLVITAIYWLSQVSRRTKAETWTGVIRLAWPLAIWGGIGVITLFLLWPAMWVQPLAIAKQLVRESIDYAVQGHSSPVVFNGVVYKDGIVPSSIWQYYPLSYLWRVSPVVLIGLVLTLPAYIFKRDPFDEPTRRFTFIALLAFAIGFIVFMSVGSKRSDRYVLPVFPALSVAAGLGWAATFFWIRGITQRKFGTILAVTVPLLAMTAQVVLPILHLPYYLSYFNPLMGGARKAPGVLQIGWGEGLDEAARYLNSMPGAETLKVASWYERIFSEFFVGETYNIEDMASISDGEIDFILSADYIVIYYHQFQRGMPENLLEILQDEEPIHRLWFDGLEYVRIYDPDEFAQPDR